MTQPQDALHALFDAERRLLDAEEALLEASRKQLEQTLGGALDEALAISDERERVMRLRRLADLCAQVPGPRMADNLLRILDADDERARVEAGEALTDVAYSRYAEVARAIDRALDAKHEGLGMRELPFILAQIGEPGALKQLRRFAQAKDGEIVAAAVDAMLELGDPAAVATLRELVDDPREVDISEGNEAPLIAPLGELAREAIEGLGGE